MFEDMTSALVLDQVNNPGGSMFYMYELLSALSPEPLALGKHVLNLNDDDEAIARDVISLSAGGDEVPAEDRPSAELISYSRFVVAEIEAGRKHRTLPTYLGGIKEIVPAPRPYTRPIVVLINTHTYSAAEFLAATLRDNHRSTLFGVKTGGLGGCYRPLNIHYKHSDMIWTGMTWTLGLRLNGEPFNNIGIVPDVTHSLAVEDLMNGFAGYQRALLATVDGILNSRTR